MRTPAWLLTVVLAASVACLPGGARSDRAGASSGPLRTDRARVILPLAAPRPRYLVPVRDTTYRTTVTRISGEPGGDVGPGLGKWGINTRQVYSKQQPWNVTGKLMSIENRGGSADRSPLVLDGETYRPLYTPCPTFDNYEYRWHPSPEHANEQIAVNRAGTELMWFDVVKCRKTRSWKLPFPADYGIGSGEGNVSADGRFAVISDDSRMVVVDMDPREPNAPRYPYPRIGPVYTFTPCSLDVARPTFCPNGNISISPSGRYIDLKFGSGGENCDTLCDLHRIYEVDSALVIRPHDMDAGSLRCGSFTARPNGWVFPMKHADMTRDPFDHDEDVLIGGNKCPGSKIGHLVMVRLRDGKVTALTDPANEARVSHVSARNSARPGWVYVTYARGEPGTRFNGEIVAVKLDGSGEVERYGQYHSTAKPYRAEAHGVPSPDGRRIMFASDWADACTGDCGSPGVIGAYVIDTRDSARSDPPRPAKVARPR